MNRNRIIAAAVAVGLSSQLGEAPEHPRKAHLPVTEQHANIADSYSTVGEVDYTDGDAGNIGIDVSI